MKFLGEINDSKDLVTKEYLDTVIERNMLDLSNFTSTTIGGITYVRNKDGSISMQGTSTNSLLSIPISLVLKAGQTYMFSAGTNMELDVHMTLNEEYDTNREKDIEIYPLNYDSDHSFTLFNIWIRSGTTVDSTIFPTLYKINPITEKGLLNGVSYQTGKTINTSGSVVDGENIVTNFIQVQSNAKYIFESTDGNWLNYAIYSSSQNKISVVTADSTFVKARIISIPSNGRYIRVSVNIAENLDMTSLKLI